MTIGFISKQTKKRRSQVGLTSLPSDMQPESQLWRAVLGQAIRDIYEGEEKHRQQVYAWTKTTDFLTVCDCAYVHADDMREQIYALMELPLNLAKKYGRMLREVVVSGG